MNCQNKNIYQHLPSITIFFVTPSFLFKIDIFHYSFGSRKVTKYKTCEKLFLFHLMFDFGHSLKKTLNFQTLLITLFNLYWSLISVWHHLGVSCKSHVKYMNSPTHISLFYWEKCCLYDDLKFIIMVVGRIYSTRTSKK